MVDFDTALKLVLSAVPRLPATGRDLVNALGDVLAADVPCPENIPPFPRSAMDGYAVRSRDFREERTEFVIVENIPAGVAPRHVLEEGEAARIFTGAMLPQGADAVIMQEEAELLGGNRVRFSSRPVAGKFVLKIGDVARAGDLILKRNSVLTPPALALLASAGITAATVYGRPRCCVLATGDELVEPTCFARPAQVRNSNAPMLVAALMSVGARPEYLGIARDDRPSLRALLERGLQGDILLVSGGVSVGEHDLVGDELINLGVEPIFTRIAIKPGKPLFFGRRQHAIVFGLPGHPASSLVSFELFVKPAIYKMRGFGDRPPEFRRGKLADTVTLIRDRLTFLPATFTESVRGVAIRPLEWAGSADIRALARATCLAAIPPGESPLPGGADVDFLTFRWARYCS